MALRTLGKAQWHAYFDHVSKLLAGGPVQIEVESLELDHEIQADWVRLFGIVYDEKDDILEVALEGLDHLIQKPQSIELEESPLGLNSIGILDGEGNRQFVRFRDPLMLLEI